MVMLVTLDETKQRLRFDHDAEDDDLTSLIEGASAAVMNYLKKPQDHYVDSSGFVPVDSSGTVGVPAEVKIAVLYLVGVLARDRDGTSATDWEHGYLPRPVTSILYPLRDPAIG